MPNVSHPNVIGITSFLFKYANKSRLFRGDRQKVGKDDSPIETRLTIHLRFIQSILHYAVFPPNRKDLIHN